MIKLVYCVRKRGDVEDGAFYQYWLENHGPLVKSYAETVKAVRYVQSHTILPELNRSLMEGRGLKPPYEGITEIWWHSLEDLIAGYGSAEGAKAAEALQTDESRFIDFSESRIFMTEEHEIF
jgi:hypothetical protein